VGPSQVLGKSRYSPGGSWSRSGRVLGGSRAGLRQVPVKSQVGPGKVSGGPWSSLERVLLKSRTSFDQVPCGSRSSSSRS
jgi:hypothetical protein